MIDISCNVEIVSRDTIRLRLLSGRKVLRDVQLIQPDLGWFRSLMDNKRARSDLDGYTYNAMRYLHLIDQLIDQELISLVRKKEVFMAKLELSVLSSFVTTLLMAKYQFWLYLAVCIIGGMALVIANRIAMKCYTAIEMFREQQAASVQHRYEELATMEWGDISDNYSGRNEQVKEQNSTSQKLQPRQAGSGDTLIASQS